MKLSVHQDHDGWQDEERTRHDPARRAMQELPDVNRELRCLGAGQQHAKIKRVEKARLPDPVLLFHQFGLHDRDLTRRAAEADESELEPEAEGFAKTRMRHRLRGGWIGFVR